METSINLTLLNEAFKNGKPVVCDVCGEGFLVPVNPDADFNHGFYCTKCGARTTFEPNVIVE